MKRLVVAAALPLFALAATAQVYTWKGADGQVHYSDRPPAERGTEAKKLSASVQAPEGADAARKAVAEKQMDARKEGQKAKEAATKAEKEKADSAENRQQCERAKANLEGLESGQIRFTTSPSGERVALDGAVREAELANARKSVDSWCK